MKINWPSRSSGPKAGLLAVCMLAIGLPGTSLAASLPVQRTLPMNVAHAGAQWA